MRLPFRANCDEPAHLLPAHELVNNLWRNVRVIVVVDHDPPSDNLVNSSNKHASRSDPSLKNPSADRIKCRGFGSYEAGTASPSFTSNLPTMSSRGTSPCPSRVR